MSVGTGPDDWESFPEDLDAGPLEEKDALDALDVLDPETDLAFFATHIITTADPPPLLVVDATEGDLWMTGPKEEAQSSSSNIGSSVSNSGRSSMLRFLAVNLKTPSFGRISGSGIPSVHSRRRGRRSCDPTLPPDGESQTLSFYTVVFSLFTGNGGKSSSCALVLCVVLAWIMILAQER